MTSMKFAWLGFATSLITIIPILPAAAQVGNYRSYVSASGSGTACTFSAPCSNIQNAVNVTNTGGIVSCLDEHDYSNAVTIGTSLTIDCGGWTSSAGPFTVNGPGIKVTIRNLTISDQNIGIGLTQGAALTVDNVHIVGDFAYAISVTTNTSPTRLVVKNSLFEYNTTGILIDPSSGGFLNATLDHVTITNNSGGGIKIQTTNGPVTVDITDSNISYNSGNGVNAVSGAGGPAMFSVEHSVIASNGAAGIQANGASAAALVDTTLLDSNSAGATSAVSGGRILTYGTNRIVGSSGSGFTGAASLQ
jgi:hypothetical protein